MKRFLYALQYVGLIVWSFDLALSVDKITHGHGSTHQWLLVAASLIWIVYFSVQIHVRSTDGR